jgi:hypothetical protein
MKTQSVTAVTARIEIGRLKKYRHAKSHLIIIQFLVRRW